MGLHTVVILLDLHEICKGIILISFFLIILKRIVKSGAMAQLLRTLAIPEDQYLIPSTYMG